MPIRTAMNKACTVGLATATVAGLAVAVAPAASANPIPPVPTPCAPTHRKYHIMNNQTGGMEGTVAMNITACHHTDTTTWGETITEAEAADKIGVFGGTVKASGPDTVVLNPGQRVMSTRIDLKSCPPIPADWVDNACVDWASWKVEHIMTKTQDGNVMYRENIVPLGVYGRDPNSWPQSTYRIDAE